MVQADTIILSGDDAINLYLQGKDVWNKWVEENPEAHIDFRGIDFSTFQMENKFSANFNGFNFPRGGVDFSYSKFGDGCVTFTNVVFNSLFVKFDGAMFGNGDINFYFTKFLSPYVDFTDVAFGKGNVYFNEAIFKAGINLKDSSLEQGNLSFFGTTFGTGILDFTSMTINGNFNFLHIKNVEQIQEISFKYSSFKRCFDISNNKFNCVVDLTQTDMSHHVSLEGLVCKPRGGSMNQLIKRDKNDISKFRRLKELAENNKDHERALEFHAQEMRAKRWHENTTRNGLFLDICFDKLSNYGRSELRPFLAILFTWILFAFGYLSASPITAIGYSGFFEKSYEALSFSSSQILPTIPSSRLARTEGIETLFNGDLSPLMHLAMFTQSIISLLLLFLIGLALRNRFKI